LIKYGKKTLLQKQVKKRATELERPFIDIMARDPQAFVKKIPTVTKE